MQLEALKTFVDIVRHASFSRGAAENQLSQSSASHVVSELERRLGVRLIDRSVRPLVPTEQGRVFYEGAKEIVARYTELEARVKSLAAHAAVGGTVRIAAIYSIGLHHLSPYVERFRTLHPAAEVRLEYLHPSRVVAELREGGADLGLISFPRRSADLVVIPWQEEEMVLALHPRHPLAGAPRVAVSDLKDVRLVGFDPDLAIGKAIEKFLKQHGVSVETVLEFDNIENIKTALLDLPAGAAILPAPSLARELAAGTLVAVPFHEPRFTRPLAILHRRVGDLGPAASRFLSILTGEGPEPASLCCGSTTTNGHDLHLEQNGRSHS